MDLVKLIIHGRIYQRIVASYKRKIAHELTPRFLEERLEIAYNCLKEEDSNGAEVYKTRIDYLPKTDSYSSNKHLVDLGIDIVGPIDHIPPFLVALNREEKDRIILNTKNGIDCCQYQLIVSDQILLARTLLLRNPKELLITNTGLVYLNLITAKGHNYKKQVLLPEAYKSIPAILLKNNIESMIKYFISFYTFEERDHYYDKMDRTNNTSIRSCRIIFSNNYLRGEIVKILDKVGARKVE